jgi:hypothetical protein
MIAHAAIRAVRRSMALARANYGPDHVNHEVLDRVAGLRIARLSPLIYGAGEMLSPNPQNQ